MAQTKEAIGLLTQEAAKGHLGHRVKQPPILFEIVLFALLQ